ncbi:hypothetical protein E2562_015482 [Oryza meyeriana var. granulata]|uniref:Amidase domain-containing protein n=1 Tax=Oryza meyeriana var. granulata TaxID=110450 RepID=A0A6G1BWQ4_9ORYZ|nr:hypothetical protein E2562_015482 [Oryza meyeriana var. granulata]
MAQLRLQLVAAIVAVAALGGACSATAGFEFNEVTVDAIQSGFKNGSLTSKQLVLFYLDRIARLNPLLHAVIEVNPDALAQAARADAERASGHRRRCGPLHGVPILLKDNIATRDRLNTTAGQVFVELSMKNPYVRSVTPCGSSSGSAVAAAANLAAVTLGTETDGSILCPASMNSVVGIKPTVGLTSRAGVIPITPRQDTVG